MRDHLGPTSKQRWDPNTDRRQKGANRKGYHIGNVLCISAGQWNIVNVGVKTVM